jgi:hypothetical protein
MSIQRFETGPRMSQVVVHGNTVYLAGVVANKAAGESVTKQTQDILATIDSRDERGVGRLGLARQHPGSRHRRSQARGGSVHRRDHGHRGEVNSR